MKISNYFHLGNFQFLPNSMSDIGSGKQIFRRKYKQSYM